MSPCSTCTAKCCGYFVIEIDTPRSKREFENLKWILAHKDVEIYVEKKIWHLEVKNKCKYIDKDHRCGIYEDRPLVCREHDVSECEHVHNDTFKHDLVFTDIKDMDDFMVKRFKKTKKIMGLIEIISKTAVKSVAVVIIFIFFASNSLAGKVDDKDLLDVLPEAEVFVRKEEPMGHFLGYEKDKQTLVGVVFLTSEVSGKKTQGYSGQIETLVGVDADGKISGIKVLNHREAPQYVGGAFDKESRFLNQFIGNVQGDKVDAITGATMSSSGVISAVETGLVAVNENILTNRQKILKAKKGIIQNLINQIDFLLIWVLLLLSFVAFYKKNIILTYFVWGLSILYVGFLKGGGFSILDIFRMGSGVFPSISNNLYWYSLIVIVFGTAVFAGRFYCGWICPFGAIQKVLYKIVPAKFCINKNISKYLKYGNYVVLFGLVSLYFLFFKKDSAIRLAGAIEPFAAFFKVHAEVIVWTWIAVILFISSCIFRFFCWFICPAGAFFALITRAAALLKLKRINVGKNDGLDFEECFLCERCIPGCAANKD